MDKFNIILIILIFTSLVIIISIFGKNLKNFKQAEKSSKLRAEIGKRGKKEGGFSFGLVFAKISDFFVWLAETVVSNAGKALKAAHAGLLEMKAKRGNKSISQDSQNLSDPFEERKEETGRNLDFEKRMPTGRRMANLKNKFAKTKDSIKFPRRDGNRPEQEEFVEEERRAYVKTVDFSAEDAKDMKLKDFFQTPDSSAQKMEDISKNDYFEQDFEREEADENYKEVGLEREKGFFGKLNPFKKKSQTKEQEILPEESLNEFSAGVTSVRRESLGREEDAYMKDVVRTKHVPRRDTGDDDDLGVDRQILEKRILQKIASNPKDIESYRQLGELYIKMENFDDAHSAYKFILKVSARDVDASRKIEKIKLLKRLK